MRKFKLQVHTTVDGYMGGPNGEMDWVTLDELHLFVNPTAIGSGMPVFGNLGTYQRLRLVTAQPFDCGITALHFEPKRS